MHFTRATVLSLISMATIGLAVPADQAYDQNLQIRTDAPKFKVCTGIDHTGECEDLDFRADTCMSLNDLKWTNRIQSVGVPNGFTCRLWDSGSCNGKNTPTITNVDRDGYTLWQGNDKSFADMATSFKCYGA